MTSSSARRDLRDATGVRLAALLEENRENPRPGEAAVVATVVDSSFARTQKESFAKAIISAAHAANTMSAIPPGATTKNYYKQDVSAVARLMTCPGQFGQSDRRGGGSFGGRRAMSGQCPRLQERKRGHLAVPLLGGIFQNTCSDLDLQNL